jgi:D-threo-aldose 1-dehydrogenase
MAPEEKVKMTRLGRTGLTIPKVGFGTSGLGSMPDTYGYEVTEERAKATVRAVLDGPAKFIDTSRNYGFGRSEQRVGAVVRERGGWPKDAILSTKLDRDAERGNRFDAAQVRRSLETSLKTLGVDRVNILHLHDPEYAANLSEVTGPKGAIAELFKMKEEGLADAVGLAAGRVDIMIPMLKDWDFDVLITHNRFTLANRNAEEMMDLAVKKGTAILNAAPYAGGVLAKGSETYHHYVYQPASGAMLDPIRRIEAICAKHKVPPGAAALQFSMRDPRVASTICGVTKPERVQQTLEWATFPVPAAMWEELKALPFSTDDPEATRVYKLG